MNPTSHGLLTLRDLIRYAVSRFEQSAIALGHGTHSSFEEAAFLVQRALHLPLDRLEMYADARLTPPEIERVLQLIERRATERVPAAYLVGEAWLTGFRFAIDARALIPRSFIAELLEDGLAPWIEDPDAVMHVLDLCTGAAPLAIIAAHAFAHAQVDAVDLSADALALARTNVAAYGLADRLALLSSDLYGALAGRRYDLILSNPPYVTAAAMAALPPEYRHEPALALAAGDDGLDLVRRIVAGARAQLTPNGLLVVEVGDGRAAVEAAFPTLPLTWLTTSAGDDMVFLAHARDLP